MVYVVCFGVPDSDQFPIFIEARVSVQDFVTFWARRYNYGREDLYSDNIGQPLTTESVKRLFEWKNGSRLSQKKQLSIERNYISRISELTTLPSDLSAKEFLQLFSSGGAIWRIFWLHCWQPQRFPIYDQHVHRAMTSIQEGKPREISSDDPDRIHSYLERYLPFHRSFDGLDLVSVDRALWMYGKVLKLAHL